MNGAVESKDQRLPSLDLAARIIALFRPWSWTLAFGYSTFFAQGQPWGRGSLRSSCWRRLPHCSDGFDTNG